MRIQPATHDGSEVACQFMDFANIPSFCSGGKAKLSWNDTSASPNSLSQGDQALFSNARILHLRAATVVQDYLSPTTVMQIMEFSTSTDLEFFKSKSTIFGVFKSLWPTWPRLETGLYARPWRSRNGRRAGKFADPVRRAQ